MAGEAISALATFQRLQMAFAIVYDDGGLTTNQCPASRTISDNSCYDFVIVGAGTAGTVLANRLTENGDNTVLLIDPGHCPPLESVLPALFPLLPNTTHDWNYKTVNDGYSAQNHQDNAEVITAGKVIGGSSGLKHLIHYQAAPSDYARWAVCADDPSWNYTNIQKYILKSEKMEDSTILNSSYSSYHGTSGNLRLTREPNDSNDVVFEALAELGYEEKVDISGTEPFGVCEPILNIADGIRQDANKAYLNPIKNRKNFYLLTPATVTEILINSNNVATGVEYVDSSGVTYTACANKEVIISAGAISSPNILQKSGIGPTSTLESAGITVKADLPVGENLQDHVTSPIVFTFGSANVSTEPMNPNMFPAPMTTAYKDYDGDGSIPDYQVINLIFTPQSAGLLQLCLLSFRYSPEVCQKLYDASSSKNLLFCVLGKSHPESTGRTYINTTDPSAMPIIELGLMSNQNDLRDMGLYLKDYSAILNTTAFKALGAEMVELGLCDHTTFGTTEYWECYALAMSSSNHHPAGTCAMGSVINNRLQVYGIENLRVVDASSICSLPSAHISASLTALAEKAADMIKEDHNIV